MPPKVERRPGRRRSGTSISNNDGPGYRLSNLDGQPLAEGWLRRRFGLSPQLARLIAQVAGLGGGA
jgi:hypothetical protein